ncbi:hypothetical protein FOXB_07881 [Fusarium oxysporum f. sp. conglutinans Fo5176]|uniref:Uncharacterized protein n=1 Tax=Fusarium oxysporum (strain Fo5176) TaxID=660025 RepID=F9FNA1_FUSOF|nr:hypothetical protein FOXB_07881 [Fusarium oxysporum f. sp. conglutinans Fo5176]
MPATSRGTRKGLVSSWLVKKKFDGKVLEDIKINSTTIDIVINY